MANKKKERINGIILSHNQPYGNLTPSTPDKEMTAKIKEAGVYLNIKVLDHLIVSRGGYYSFADEGKNVSPSKTSPFFFCRNVSC